MQGLFGRFGKKQPTVVSPLDFQSNSQSTSTDIEFDEFPITSRFDDDEETNWDDVETLVDPDRVAYPQPIIPVKPPAPPTAPDLEDWDEALPAATVKNSNTQEARRGKDRTSTTSGDLGENPRPTTVPDRSNPSKSAPSPTEKAIGFWTAIMQQFRRILPPPIRQLSDPILTIMMAIVLTVAIWLIDSFLAIPPQPQTIATPTAPIAAPPNATSSQINPEQAFIDAIQAQLSEITREYPDDIVQTLQVDLPRDLAIVRLNPIWYTIGDNQQDLVTDRMWLQAQANHFSKLELQDADGHSIARSPVVGQHMVILHRRLDS
jgi:hypothetical protein